MADPVKEVETMDKLLETLSVQPFCVDLAIGTSSVMLRWGIPVSLYDTTVSKNAETLSVRLAEGKDFSDSNSLSKRYDWIRSKAKETDRWNRNMDIGIVLGKLINAMNGFTPGESRSGRSRILYSGPTCRGIEYFYAFARDFPEGNTSSLTRVDEYELAEAIRLCETECDSLLLECCREVRVIESSAEMVPTSVDFPGATTTYPHSSKHSAERVSEERRKRLRSLDKKYPEESAPTTYVPTSPKYWYELSSSE
jgi:hypothetical protein